MRCYWPLCAWMLLGCGEAFTAVEGNAEAGLDGPFLAKFPDARADDENTADRGAPDVLDDGVEEPRNDGSSGFDASQKDASNDNSQRDASNDAKNEDAQRGEDVIVVPPPSACPMNPPSGMASCGGSFSCTYGDNPKPSCRTRYSCQGSHWLNPPPMACTSPQTCESVPILPVIGKACGTPQQECLWSSGLFCKCLPCVSSQGVCATPQWDCYPAPSAPCPAVPPNEGSVCDQGANLKCSYGTCRLGNAVIATCSAGTWVWSQPVPACP